LLLPVAKSLILAGKDDLAALPRAMMIKSRA